MWVLGFGATYMRDLTVLVTNKNLLSVTVKKSILQHISFGKHIFIISEIVKGPVPLQFFGTL